MIRIMEHIVVASALSKRCKSHYKLVSTEETRKQKNHSSKVSILIKKEVLRVCLESAVKIVLKFEELRKQMNCSSIISR